MAANAHTNVNGLLQNSGLKSQLKLLTVPLDKAFWSVHIHIQIAKQQIFCRRGGFPWMMDQTL
jgi:hypothetical protein